jgi:signal transduction histidine kinase
MLVLSHEIMNSMTPVTSLAQSTAALLRDVDGPGDALDQARAAIESLSRRSEGLLRFVEGYRALARLPEPRLQSTDLSELVADMAQLFRSRWSAQGVELETDVEPLLRKSVDGALISQALLNVLTNAAEAALAGGGPAQVRLSAHREAEGVTVIVEDTGPGFEPGAPGLVFRPFFTTKAGGSGVGLSISRQIVLAHGGDISAAPGEAGGACFTIRL